MGIANRQAVGRRRLPVTNWSARCEKFLRLLRRHAARPERFSPADRRRIMRLLAAILVAPDPWLSLRATGVLIRLAETKQRREKPAHWQ